MNDSYRRAHELMEGPTRTEDLLLAVETQLTDDDLALLSIGLDDLATGRKRVIRKADRQLGRIAA